ncbi:Uncharacterised protein [Mycobacteroides abscessus]|nr:Uncharacterised protein [Mycobacteroides abscessus]
MENPTRNDTSGLRNARSANTAAPPACGYLVTSSAYEPAVSRARPRATRSGSQTAPPTSPAISPTSA